MGWRADHRFLSGWFTHKARRREAYCVGEKRTKARERDKERDVPCSMSSAPSPRLPNVFLGIAEPPFKGIEREGEAGGTFSTDTIIYTQYLTN